MQLAGRRALVTGGSSGIGRAVAVSLARRGCQVTVVGSDAGRVAAAAAEVAAAPDLAASSPSPSPSPAPAPTAPSRVSTDAPERVVEQSTRHLMCDFADAEAVARLADQLAAGPAFDLVVHSAGVGLRRPAAALTAEALDALLAVNIRAPLLLTSAVLAPMVSGGSGRLVFVGSIAGAVGAAGESAYAASKAALTGYADSLRVELAGTGVGVTVLVPGVVDTDFFTRRGTPYHRSKPRPVSVNRVARALLRAVERDRDLVVVPGWLRLAIALHGLLPQTFSRMSGRWGR